MAGKRMLIRLWYPYERLGDKPFEFFIKADAANIVNDICQNKMRASFNPQRAQYQFKSKADAALARDKIAEYIL